MKRSIARIVTNRQIGHFHLRNDRTVRANNNPDSPPRNGEVTTITQDDFGFTLVVAAGMGKGVLCIPAHAVDYAFVTADVAGFAAAEAEQVQVDVHPDIASTVGQQEASAKKTRKPKS